MLHFETGRVLWIFGFYGMMDTEYGGMDMELGRKIAGGSPVTRLLREAAGRLVKITFTEDDMDFDISNKKCRILDFDGSWASVEYQNGKKTETKLIQIASIASIKFEREEQ